MADTISRPVEVHANSGADLLQAPEYSGNSIVNLMASLALGLGAPGHAYAALEMELPGLRNCRNVVLMVIDGCGAELLQAHRECSWLHEHWHGTLDSVFPSTTASAITTFLTGLAPQQHGLTGWHVYSPEIDAVAAVLPGRVRGGSEKLGRYACRQLYDQQAFADQLPVSSHAVVPSWIAESRYNVACSGRARAHTYAVLPDFFNVLATAVRQSPAARNYFYAYYPELDRRAHEYGCASEAVADLLEQLDRGLAKLIRALRGTDTLLLITADHGFIDTTPGHRIELEQHPRLAECLKRPLCGESRVAYCYVKEDRHSDFSAYVQQELDGRVSLVDRDTLLARGYYGLGKPHPRLRERVGDFILLLHDRYTLKDWLPGEERYTHIGVHGGSTRAEREVPLILAAIP